MEIDMSKAKKPLKMTLQEVARCFEGAPSRIHKNQFKCMCPAHADDKESLHVQQMPDGAIVLKCHAGCNFNDIIEAAGLVRENLGTANEEKWKDTIPLNKDEKVVTVYHYTDEKGAYLYSKVRVKCKKGKRFIFGYIEGDDFVTSMPHDIEPVLYNLKRVRWAIKRRRTIYICEGEKDVDTMTKHKLPATTSGGANTWKPEFARYFKGAKVVILADNDPAGLNYAREIQLSLQSWAHKTIIVTPSDEDKGDITDFFEAGGTKEELLDMVAEESAKGNWNTAPWIVINDKTKKESINESLLADAILETLEYIVVANNIGSNDCNLYIYENGRYMEIGEPFIHNRISSYIPSNLLTSRICKEVYNMILIKACNLDNIDKVVRYDELDGDENIINFRNGVLNLNTGELMPHSPAYKCTRQLDLDYVPYDEFTKEDGKVFKRFIRHLIGKDVMMRNLVLEAMGLVFSNVRGYRTKKCIFMTGKGNTGKSQLKGLMAEILGQDYVSTLELSQLEGERFALSDIYGKRLIGSDDMSYSKAEELKNLKKLTGGDILSIERKGRDFFQYRFKGFAWFCMNQLPKFGGDKGKHVYERIIVIKCENVVAESKRDSRIIRKMLAEKEYIVSLCIEHLKNLIARGYKFDEPEIVIANRDEYEVSNDSVREFFSSDITITGSAQDTITKKGLWELYSNWCKDNRRSPTGRNKAYYIIEEELNIKAHKLHGQTVYRGIKVGN